MKKQILFLLIFTSLLSVNLHAQKLKTLLKDGDAAFADSDFFGASIYYGRAILKDSIDPVIQYKYAEASRLNYDFKVAGKWYNKVYKLDRSGRVYPECGFWLAMIKKHEGKYRSAGTFFSRYVKRNKKKKNSYFVKKAIQEMVACKYAVKLISNPDKTITIIHLDSTVNSVVSEYAPIKVDSVLYFSSLRDNSEHDNKNDINYNKIYAAVYDSIKWQQSKELDSILFNKSGLHNANTAFNEDFTKLYTTRCEQKNAQDFICEIYYSELKTDQWEPLQKLTSDVNMVGFTNTHPAVGYLGDDEVLFFASNRPKGFGKMDIWYSKINDDGSFENAVNAGAQVNSIDDEITPFYCKPCQELFFSSDWHKGLGGFDIFKSAYENKALGEPKNLGLPVNSNYNDIYFSINAEKTEAFLSSNRKGSFFEEKESCCNDIYMFKIPQPVVVDTVKKEEPEVLDTAQVLMANMKKLVPLSLYFHNDEPDKKTLDTTTTLNYKKTYEDYTAMRELYNKKYLKGVAAEDLEHAKDNMNILFDNFIDGGMKELEQFSLLLLKVLKQNEKVNITMMGYCSPLASTDYNVNLAKRRMSSLLNYFTAYKDGVFVPYINNQNADEGSVTFKYNDIGEIKADKNVSDDYYDTQNSIYNPRAALERKIQIIAVATFSSETE